VTGLTLEARDRSTILIHYYRAMVGRADVWRMRMDATSNWAIGATAAVISFALGNPSAPHYVVHIAGLMTLGFLLLEARRLTFYHLFQQRVLLLEEGLIRPALGGGEEARVEAKLEEALRDHLGRTVPTMPLLKAVARRLRRIYLYLFAVQLFAWGLKLSNHPSAAGTVEELIARAGAGPFSGLGFVGMSFGLMAIAVIIAVAQGGVDRTRAQADLD